tara:strand:- start:269 stop:574 length:306 start_codon:yes stop_codon:yes gene_type:complete
LEAFISECLLLQWNAIKPAPAPLQAQPTIPVQPRNTADAFSLLANYVNTATAEKSPSVYSSAFEDPEKQWQRYMAAFRTSDIDRLMVEEAAKVSQCHLEAG